MLFGAKHYKIRPFCVQTVMPFVGDHVTCNAAKVLGNRHAKQRYGTLFKEIELLVSVQRIEVKGRSVKYIVYFDEVTTSKVFSARSIRLQITAAGGNAEASIPRAISIVNSSLIRRLKSYMNKKAMTSVMGSSLSCHGVQWKALDGIVEDPHLSLVHCFLCSYLC